MGRKSKGSDGRLGRLRPAPVLRDSEMDVVWLQESIEETMVVLGRLPEHSASHTPEEDLCGVCTLKVWLQKAKSELGRLRARRQVA